MLLAIRLNFDRPLEENRRAIISLRIGVGALLHDPFQLQLADMTTGKLSPVAHATATRKTNFRSSQTNVRSGIVAS